MIINVNQFYSEWTCELPIVDVGKEPIFLHTYITIQ